MKKIFIFTILSILVLSTYGQKIEKVDFVANNQIQISINDITENNIVSDKDVVYAWIDDGASLIYFEKIKNIDGQSFVLKFPDEVRIKDNGYSIFFYSTKVGVLSYKI